MKPRAGQFVWSLTRIVVPLVVAAASAGVIVVPRMGESVRLDREIAASMSEVDRGHAAAIEVRDVSAEERERVRLLRLWRSVAVTASDDERSRYEYFRRIEALLGVEIALVVAADGSRQFANGPSDSMAAPFDPPRLLPSGLWARRIRIEVGGDYFALVNFIEIMQFGPRVLALREIHMDTVGGASRHRLAMTIDWLLDPERVGADRSGDLK